MAVDVLRNEKQSGAISLVDINLTMIANRCERMIGTKSLVRAFGASQPQQRGIFANGRKPERIERV